MPTLAPTLPERSWPLPAPEEVFRISVDRYERMVESGMLGEDDPIELLSGVIVWKMPKNPRHSTVVRRCQRIIESLVPSGWHVRKEEPARIPDYDEPEPDLTVVRGDGQLYENHHPGPNDVALIIEVAESSLTRDRGLKREIYARAGIAAYWVINLIDRQIESYSDPVGNAYPAPKVFRETDLVELIVDGQVAGAILVADLLTKP
jgi:Uma2 family endonuclease